MKKRSYLIGKHMSRALLLLAVFVLGCSGDRKQLYVGNFVTGNIVNTGRNEDASERPVINAGLIGRWSFDGSDIGRNSVSDKHHARIKNKVKTVPGVIGKAIELTRTDSAAIEIAPDVLPEGLKELTFTAWIAPKSLDNASIIRKEDVGHHGENRLLFAFQNNGKFLSLGINCGGNYAECDAIVSTQELCDGKWHLAAGTFDGQIMRVYLDGREIGSFERQAPINTIHDFSPIKKWRDDIAHSNYSSLEAVAVQGVPMYIGSTEGVKKFFSGKIDDVRFYSKALDDLQLATLYAEGKQPESDVVKKNKETAKKFYAKSSSFIETLYETDKN